MLQTFRSVNINGTFIITWEQHWGWCTESDNGFWGGVFGTVLKLIEMGDDWSKVIDVKIPNFDSSVICDRGEARWSTWWPVNIIDLTCQWFISWYLMATEFLNFLSCMPHLNSPIIWTTDKDWAFLRLPERITSNPVDWSLMTVVILKILIWVRNTTLMDRALFSGSIVSDILS